MVAPPAAGPQEFTDSMMRCSNLAEGQEITPRCRGRSAPLSDLSEVIPVEDLGLDDRHAAASRRLQGGVAPGLSTRAISRRDQAA